MDKADREGLEQALRRNLFDDAETASVARLSQYLEERDRELAGQPIADIIKGRLNMEQAA